MRDLFMWGNDTIYLVEMRSNCICRFYLDVTCNCVLKKRNYDINDSRLYPIHFSFQSILIFEHNLNAAIIIE
jgi:hypothetical protein